MNSPVVAVQESGEIRVVAAERPVEWLKAGWQMFRAAPGVWALIGLALLVINVVLGLLPPPLAGAASCLLMPLLGGGLMAGCAAQDRGEPIRFDYLHLGFREHTSPLLNTGVWLLGGFVVAAVIALTVGGVGALLGQLGSTGFGTVLALGSLLLAGIAMLTLLTALGMAAWFAPALVALSLRPPKEALMASFLACLKNWLALLVYGILLWLLLALCVLTAGLGLLVLIPVVATSTYHAYRDIFA